MGRTDCYVARWWERAEIQIWVRISRGRVVRILDSGRFAIMKVQSGLTKDWNVRFERQEVVFVVKFESSDLK